MKTTHKSKVLISTIIFFFIFSIGLLNIRNYPMDYDDYSEKVILWSNVSDYCQFLGLSTPSAPVLNETEVPLIHESIERDHGVAALYLLTPFLTIEDERTVGFCWHLYLYVFFCMSAVFMFLCLDKLFENKFVSYFCSLMYFLSPRLFGDSLHNNKDIIFLSLLTIMLYYTISMTEKDRVLFPVMFAVFGGLFCNTRILGLYFTAVFGIIYILVITYRKKWSRKKFTGGLIAAIGTLITYIIVTPAIYAGGKFNLIGQISYCLERTSNFTAWWAPVLFEGHVYDWRNESLPWYYIPKYILITTPPIVILFFVIGLVSTMVLIKKKSNQGLYCGLLFISGFLPLFVAIIKKSILYNGWRHFYFLYSIIIIISAAGLNLLITRFSEKENKSHRKNLLYSICLMSILFYGLGNAYYQIGGAMYFNLFAGSNVPMRYEMDYSAVIGKEVLRHWIKTVDEDQIFLYFDGADISVINNCFSVIDDDIRNKVTLVNDRELALSLVDRGYPVYEYFDPDHAYWFGNDRWAYFSNMENVYTYKPWGRTAGAIYRFP